MKNLGNGYSYRGYFIERGSQWNIYPGNQAAMMIPEYATIIEEGCESLTEVKSIIDSWMDAK